MVAEVIGTFALLFVGMLAIVNNAGLLGVAFAHGLAIAVIAMALGTVSGGQFNLAVSVGLSLAGKQSWADTGKFIVAQLVGAALGGFAALAVAGHDALAKVAFAQPHLGTGVSTLGGIFAEAIATFFLVLIVLKVAVRQGHAMGGLIVGLTITAGILAIGVETGAALNPARSFGAAVVSGAWGDPVAVLGWPTAGRCPGGGNGHVYVAAPFTPVQLSGQLSSQLSHQQPASSHLPLEAVALALKFG